ncbi:MULTISPECIES: response regulator transcription factor [unclassified Corynebacterium]|uniref:response regulator transcription factor n=1 Tax=unclassified Corynebacterium TaxID=2624378 RepID=UPI0029CA015A|nr:MULTISPECIES: response regulator transcription factor [unclassified Corynebacterium]WPF66115.1 response regulator transcription factor [Corynebacterium sp. 22KM0430]WPF68607.1 response regulator transcription factor [Corynebacterium sp. 21KM1197]
MIRVMLIDDHPVVRAGLRAILDSFEDITVVAEGASGPNPAEIPEDVDVLVMDIQMPSVDGIQATRALREAGGPPVLILTTYDAQADIVAALSAGALGYLLKDAPEEELHRAVVATAQGKRTLSPEVATALAERVGRPQEALSARETEILRALATGATNQQLARSLFISLGTVKTHLLHIYQKLGVDNRTAAIAKAREERLI